MKLAIGLALLAAPALSQSAEPIVEPGMIVPGVGDVTGVYSAVISDQGDWVSFVNTDNPNPGVRRVVLLNGELIYQEGDPVPPIGGARFTGFTPLGLSSKGDLLMNVNYRVNGNNRNGLHLNGTLLLREGAPLVHPELSPGTRFIGVADACINNQDQVLLVAYIDDPLTPGIGDEALLLLDVSGGTIQSMTVLAQTGDTLPGLSSHVLSFNTFNFALGICEAGHAFYVVKTTFASPRHHVFLDQTLLAEDGSPSPIPGRNWKNLRGGALGANGDYALSGSLDGDTATGRLLVKNGSVLGQRGSTLPAIAPFPLDDIYGDSLSVDKFGKVLWLASWDGSSSNGDYGFFKDTELLIKPGDPTTQGPPLTSLSDNVGSQGLSDNGRWHLFRGTYGSSGSTMFRVSRSLGTYMCLSAAPNSTGNVGDLTVTGIDAAGGNPLTLIASLLPAHQFGFFLTSKTSALVPGAGGGQGTLCLGGSIGRFVAGMGSTGAGGCIELDVDTSALPLSPTVAVLPGETWKFQFWHRDLNPGPTHNFTFGRRVTFE